MSRSRCWRLELRLKLDDDFPEVTQALLGVLYPHYLAPVPSTAIVEFALDQRQADLVGGYRVEAGESIETESTEDGACQFRTVYPVDLFPMKVQQASYKGQPFQSPPSPMLGKTESVLQVHLKNVSAERPGRSDGDQVPAFFHSRDFARRDGPA